MVNVARRRNCSKPIPEMPRLFLGTRSVPSGSTQLCIDCVDKLMPTMAPPDNRTLRGFVTAYIKASRQTDTVQSLKSRVEELERLLEGLTNPKSDQ